MKWNVFLCIQISLINSITRWKRIPESVLVGFVAGSLLVEPPIDEMNGLVYVGIIKGLVTGGFPVGFDKVVGLVRSGIIRAGISLIVVHVTNWVCVEPLDDIVHGRVEYVVDDDKDDVHGLNGFSVTSFSLSFSTSTVLLIFRFCSNEIVVFVPYVLLLMKVEEEIVVEGRLGDCVVTGILIYVVGDVVVV